MSYQYVYIIGAVVVVFAIWSRWKLAKGKREQGDKNVSAVAARLGMGVVEGDGNINLYYFQQPARDFERKIVCHGQPYGRPASWWLMDGQKTNDYLVVRKITHSFGCFLEVQTQIQGPVFEAVLRAPNEYLIPHQELAERGDLHPVSTGNAQLDAMFVVRASDPRVGPALAPALTILASHLYVHLAGSENRIWSSFSRTALPYFGSAAEEYLLAVEAAACAIEGRPIPAQPVMTAHAAGPHTGPSA